MNDTTTIPQPKKRKRRSDRKHIVYRIDNTITGEFYIGITVVIGNAFRKSLYGRFKKHIHRATFENKVWNLCNSIREYGEKAFVPTILEHINGKLNAHQRENELIKLLNPQLNSTN